MNELDLQLLERYLDGEISADEIHEVEQALATDEAWQAAHRELLATRTAVRAHYEAMTEAVDFSDLWSAVEAQLPDGPPEVAPEEAPAVAPAPMPAPTPARPSFMGWLQDRWGTILISAGAAAAVAFFVGRAGQQPTPPEASQPTIAKDTPSGAGGPATQLRPAPSPALPPSAGSPELKQVGRVVVDGVKSEGDNRVIITQPDDEPTVIWLLEEDNSNLNADPDASPGEDPI